MTVVGSGRGPPREDPAFSCIGSAAGRPRGRVRACRVELGNHERKTCTGGQVSIGGNDGFDANYEAADERARLARLALPDRREASRYLAALASEGLALVFVVLAATSSPLWLLPAVPLGLWPGFYFSYLAQRTQGATRAGDYLVGPRLELRATGMSLGSLFFRAWDLVRGPDAE